MTVSDVLMMRLQNHALSLLFAVVQDVITHKLILLPTAGGSVTFSDVAAARSWLRVRAHCGIYGRRCSAGCGLVEHGC